MTKVTGKIEVGEKEFKLAFYDGVNDNNEPSTDMMQRFEKIKDYTTSLERTIVKELGLDLESYIKWRNI